MSTIQQEKDERNAYQRTLMRKKRAEDPKYGQFGPADRRLTKGYCPKCRKTVPWALATQGKNAVFHCPDCKTELETIVRQRPGGKRRCASDAYCPKCDKVTPFSTSPVKDGLGVCADCEEPLMLFRRQKRFAQKETTG